VASVSSVTPAVAEKARRLVDQRRVVLRGEDTAYVLGDSETYKVIAFREGVSCPCKAWRSGAPCSHVTAAMIAWAERGTG
jgi:hypothetical protein